MAADLVGKVALVTGAAHGIGAALAERLAGRGASVVIADVDVVAAEEVASAVGGLAVRCDVSSPADNEAAVAAAVERFGGLDLAVLNAGVVTGCGLGDDFDPQRYGRVRSVNLDGPVLGLHAVWPALRARGGGDVIVTSSMAALAPMADDPLYAATKAGVLALVRALAPTWAAAGVRLNAVCPSFAETALVEDHREVIAAMGLPLLSVDAVADAFEAVLATGRSGEAWMVIPGRAPEPFRFGGVPGPR